MTPTYHVIHTLKNNPQSETSSTVNRLSVMHIDCGIYVISMILKPREILEENGDTFNLLTSSQTS